MRGVDVALSSDPPLPRVSGRRRHSPRSQGSLIIHWKINLETVCWSEARQEAGSRLPAIVTAPRKVPERPTRMTKVGMERRSCVRDVAEFNLQSLAMDGIKRRGKRGQFCGWMMGSH